MVFFVAKFVEVSPDVERLLQQEESVRRGERALFLSWRRIEPDRDEWRECPKQQDGSRREQGLNVRHGEEKPQ